MMKYISTTEYLNYEGVICNFYRIYIPGDKFSKGNGVGVFGDDAMNSGIPSEVWRRAYSLYKP